MNKDIKKNSFFKVIIYFYLKFKKICLFCYFDYNIIMNHNLIKIFEDTQNTYKTNSRINIFSDYESILAGTKQL